MGGLPIPGSIGRRPGGALGPCWRCGQGWPHRPRRGPEGRRFDLIAGRDVCGPPPGPPREPPWFGARVMIGVSGRIVRRTRGRLIDQLRGFGEEDLELGPLGAVEGRRGMGGRRRDGFVKITFRRPEEGPLLVVVSEPVLHARHQGAAEPFPRGIPGQEFAAGVPGLGGRAEAEKRDRPGEPLISGGIGGGGQVGREPGESVGGPSPPRPRAQALTGSQSASPRDPVGRLANQSRRFAW